VKIIKFKYISVCEYQCIPKLVYEDESLLRYIVQILVKTNIDKLFCEYGNMHYLNEANIGLCWY